MGENLFLAVFLVKNKQKVSFTFVCVCPMQIHLFKGKKTSPQVFHDMFLFFFFIAAYSLSAFRNLAFHRLVLLTEDSLSQSSQLHVGVLESFLHLLIHRLLLALDDNGRATVQDPFRGSLHHQQVTIIIWILCFVHGELEERAIMVSTVQV